MPVIMGTAGHIDHGKTSLIKALTGINCDRLAEEQKRGITIELGFAYLDLNPQLRLGIIDVPGHERFVKNMVAGAAGIDFVLLVIAADEGVMPQTREHLEICSLLGIRSGLVALTKTDMVEGDWLELVLEEVSAYLAGTFLEGAPIVPVSAHAGTGLEELRGHIVELASSFTPDRRSDLFRLPIDRVFTMKGHGTVITGTTISGSLKAGEDVEIFPAGLKSKVRGLQVHGVASEVARAGERTAVNLHSLDVDDLERGEILAHPQTLFPSMVWDVELSCLSSSPNPLKHRTEVHFHHGSREILAKLFFLDRDKLEPGQTAVCQVRFPKPLPGVFGDRCIVRSFSPLQTVAGGRIINPLGRKVRRQSKAMETLAALGSMTGEELLLAQLRLAGRNGLTVPELRIMTDMESKLLDKTLQLLGGRQLAFQFDKEDRRFVGADVLESLGQDCMAYVAEYHRREPMRQGISRAELVTSFGQTLHPKLVHFLVERLVKSGQIHLEGDIVRLPGHTVSLASDQSGLRALMESTYVQAGLMPPTTKAFLEDNNLQAKDTAQMYRLLLEEGVLVKISEEFYYARTAMDDIIGRVRGFFESHQEMGPQDFRDLTELTRKFAIPVLEYLDKEKITMRIGDKRQLRKR
ncbi:MAG: selenocysteine-specific translation elongation factor [Desulfovibrionales bacterium]|nr:selenocysteine-specific translation elongation factor [Desulfovibrionales bacterium]